MERSVKELGVVIEASHNNSDLECRVECFTEHKEIYLTMKSMVLIHSRCLALLMCLYLVELVEMLIYPPIIGQIN